MAWLLDMFRRIFNGEETSPASAAVSQDNADQRHRSTDVINRIVLAKHPQIRDLNERIAKAKRQKKRWSHLAAQKSKLIEGWLK